MTDDAPSEDESPDDESLFPFDTDWLVKAFFIVLLIWGVYLALQIPTFDRRADRVYPRLIVTGLLVLTAVQLVKMQFPSLVDRILPDVAQDEAAQELRAALSGAGEDGSGRPRHGRHKYEIIMSVWVTILPIAVFLFGFAYVLPTYVLALTYYLERSIVKALITSGIFTAFGYVVFLRLLNVPLWRGIVFGGGF